jgi:hypothetical protein
MAMESFYGLIKTIRKLSIKESSNATSFMVLGGYFGQMEIFMKEVLKMEYIVEKEILTGRIQSINTRGSSRMGRCMALECLLIHMVYLRENISLDILKAKL